MKESVATDRIRRPPVVVVIGTGDVAAGCEDGGGVEPLSGRTAEARSALAPHPLAGGLLACVRGAMHSDDGTRVRWS